MSFPMSARSGSPGAINPPPPRRKANTPPACSRPSRGRHEARAPGRDLMVVAQQTRDAWELASFVVTALGLPLAIAFFAWEERKERDNEEEAAYQLLSDAYNDFLKVVLAHPDLHLRSNEP